MIAKHPREAVVSQRHVQIAGSQLFGQQTGREKIERVARPLRVQPVDQDLRVQVGNTADLDQCAPVEWSTKRILTAEHAEVRREWNR